jgi:hypothetical protein
MQYRRPKKDDPYWVEPEIWDNVVHFCRCYPVWLKELETLPDSSKAISYDGDRVQTSGNYDVTSALALKRVEVERKVDLLRTTAMIVSPELWEWILKGTTEKGVTIEDLIAQGMPTNKNHYAKLRKYFYYLISKRI